MINLPELQEIISLPLAALGMWLMFRLASNHIQHLADRLESASDRLADRIESAIERIVEALERRDGPPQ